MGAGGPDANFEHVENTNAFHYSMRLYILCKDRFISWEPKAKSREKRKKRKEAKGGNLPMYKCVNLII
jgi:hypothetical protein